MAFRWSVQRKEGCVVGFSMKACCVISGDIARRGAVLGGGLRADAAGILAGKRGRQGCRRSQEEPAALGQRKAHLLNLHRVCGSVGWRLTQSCIVHHTYVVKE